MLEAMSCGCLVLASATPPVKEVMQDEVNGLLFDFFNPQEIVEKIDFALDNRESLGHLKTNARKIIVANYDLENMLEKQVELIEFLVK